MSGAAASDPPGRGPGPVARNAPCPCGSGRRYKACCGAAPEAAPTLPPRLEATMQQALAYQHQGRMYEAAALYRAALLQAPDLPDAVHMLGVVHLQAGEYAEALAVLRRAAALFDWQLPAVRHNLGLAIAAVLSGSDRPEIGRLWEAYDRWRDAVRATRTEGRVAVSVVVPCYNHAGYVEAALESVYAQSHADLELVVVDDGSTDGTPERVRAVLARSPFPARFTERANRGAAPTINEAIASCRGDYVNILNSDDRFAPTRIATMVDAVARRGLAWGFSRAAMIDAAGGPLSVAASDRAAALIYRIDGVAARDTVGTSFLAGNPAISTGTLFFARSLFDRLGGFADYRYNHDWDFCLRASLVAEPAFVPTAEYEYRLHDANTILESSLATKAEADAMFERFYRSAIAERAPAHPFAPVPAVWGARFFEQALAAGHAALLPRDVLVEFSERAAAAAAGERA